MDNLTHSLVGALFGQMGLKRRTGLAMPTLVIAANLPDIDATCTVFGMQSLAMRRGLTHGPIALIVLPLLLAGAMFAWDRWQARRGTRPANRLPVRAEWLVLLAYLGCLSHPALDWLNSYGIRLLAPLSQRWFYGDTLFIIDVWIWAALILAVVLSLRGERAGRLHWQRPAWAGFGAVCAYIFANGLITGHAEAQVAGRLAAERGRAPELVVANPQPLAFWRREMLWRDGDAFGSGNYELGRETRLGAEKRNLFGSTDITAFVENDANAQAFLFWSRMPVLERQGHGFRLSDQRFDNGLTRGSFSLTLPAAP